MRIVNFIRELSDGRFKKKPPPEEEIIRKEFAYTPETGIDEVLHFAKAESANLTIELKEGVTEAEIASFESGNFHLPDDFKAFYMLSNGFDTLDWLFRVIPLQEISANGQAGLHDASSFSFAEYMINSEIWNVEIKEENRYFIYKKNLGEDRVIFTNSLAEFLVRYVNGGLFEGLMAWEDEIIKDK